MQREQNKKMKINNEKGFSLIETLVAISILMISIAGPLVVANKGLNAALYAKDQSIASFLAQEGMELLRNVKDNAISKYGETGYNNFVSTVSSCTSGNTCGIGIDPTTWTTIINHCSSLYNCYLYHETGENLYYEYNSPYSGFRTIYKREFIVTPFAGNKELQITVNVSWRERGIDNSVSLVSEMTEAII